MLTVKLTPSLTSCVVKLERISGDTMTSADRDTALGGAQKSTPAGRGRHYGVFQVHVSFREPAAAF